MMIALGAFGNQVTAGGERNDCPERCGEVLKACLDESANRYHCIDVAEKCMIACKRDGKPKHTDALRIKNFSSDDCVARVRFREGVRAGPQRPARAFENQAVLRSPSSG